MLTTSIMIEIFQLQFRFENIFFKIFTDFE